MRIFLIIPPYKWLYKAIATALLLDLGLFCHSLALADAPLKANLQSYQTEIRSNESLEACLKRLHIADPAIYKAISQNPYSQELQKIPSATPIRLKVDPSGLVQSLKVPLNNQIASRSNKNGLQSLGAPHELDVLLFVRPNETPDHLKIIRLSEKTQIHIISKSGDFDGNFFNVMDRQNIPDAISDQLVRIFSSSVNFSRDLAHKANFSIKYEVAYLDDSPVATGRVVFSAINTEQKQLQAFWWQKDAGGDGYYTPNGLALNQYSWKTPILYSRKTSNFGMRPDPFTGNWANHQGIDIGAPIGTEVHVTQGGKIKFFGNQGNYGNVVIVEHANGYETVYGHLSHFANLTKQEMIPQGAVIGFVGSTGRSTGPHLHYELRQYGQAINPERDLTNLADISQSSSLNGEELKRFVKYQNSLFTSKLASR